MRKLNKKYMPLNNSINTYSFLEDMYQDSYFPDFLVDQCKLYFIDLCLSIEKEKPSELKNLYQLSLVTTEQLNDIQNEFGEHDSEIETVARESFATDFMFIATTYGFVEADAEELMAARDW